MKYKNIECNILCDDAPLTEYQEKLEGEKAMSCHVASEAGKRFIVRVRSDPHDSDFTGELWVDGKITDYICVESTEDIEYRGLRMDKNRIRAYLFSSITLTDDDGALGRDTATSAKELGNISLKCCRVRVNGDGSNIFDSYSRRLEENPQAVHEKLKKTGGHRVILGEYEEDKAYNNIKVTHIDARNSPFFTFTWRYRPKDILQAQGIIPLTKVNSSKSAAKRPISALTSSHGSGPSKRKHTEGGQGQASTSGVTVKDTLDLEALRAQRDALEAQRAALDEQQAALDEQLGRAEARVPKREGSIVLLGGSSDVIDLTGDSE